MKSNFKIINKKKLYDGFFEMNEVVLQYKKYDGSWTDNIKRELFGGAQVAAVLPFDPIKKEIVLIQQFRIGTIFQTHDNYLNEIVAGNIDNGETPEKAAKRECFEETGCEIKKLLPIQSFFPAPGSSESFYHLFLGEIETFKGTKIMGMENENEDILVKSYKLDEVMKMIKEGKIINGLTLVALQWFFLNLR